MVTVIISGKVTGGLEDDGETDFSLCISLYFLNVCHVKVLAVLINSLKNELSMLLAAIDIEIKLKLIKNIC